MNNELYRKLTSITLMTIMFAGGMTIAIPGETPVAIAQTGMLSVSATAAPGNSFGGPQIIQIEVNDPSRSETANVSKPHVTVDGDDIDMTQADTGKWYAHFASDVYDAEPDTLLSGANLLDSPPTAATRADNTQDNLIAIQEFDFTDDSDIDVVLGDETITLHYEEDLDDLATVRTDRAGVPIDGQVHVTISDFRLNLDPTAADVWYMNASSSNATYGTTNNAANTDDNALTNTDALDTNWNTLFEGKGGKFTLTDPMATISDIDVTGDEDGVVDGVNNIVRFEETGANTGVFESQNDDESNIMATGGENDDFTIKYADSDVQVFIEDFDSTLEVIADGTWNSGESLTVRLTNENLNTNTLTEQDMAIGDDNLPILMFGAPITLATVEDITPTAVDADPTTLRTPLFGEGLTIDTDTHVGTLAKSTTWNAENRNYTFTVTLTDTQTERLQDGTLNNYIHYYSSDDLTAATNAHLNGTTPDRTTTDIKVENGAQ